MEKLPDLGPMTRMAIIFMVITAIRDPTTKKPLSTELWQTIQSYISEIL